MKLSIFQVQLRGWFHTTMKGIWVSCVRNGKRREWVQLLHGFHKLASAGSELQLYANGYSPRKCSFLWSVLPCFCFQGQQVDFNVQEYLVGRCPLGRISDFPGQQQLLSPIPVLLNQERCITKQQHVLPRSPCRVGSGTRVWKPQLCSWSWPPAGSLDYIVWDMV